MTIEADKLTGVLIAPEMSVVQALRQMDESGQRIVFVVDDAGVLQGVATDGDVRRWVLAGEPLDSPVAKVMNPRPIVLEEGRPMSEAEAVMIAKRIDSLPVVDAAGRVVGAVWWTDLFEAEEPVHGQIDVPVVIMAGGEGARLAPVTKVLPKPLVPVGDKPIIELIIERFRAFGCRRFCLSVNYKSNLIRAYFSDLEPDYQVEYIEEDEPLGTAGSLRLLKGAIGGGFFVTNCDVLVDADIADVFACHVEAANDITLVASMKQYVIPYGVCEVGKGGVLKGIDEKPEYNLLVSTGLYALQPSVLDLIPETGRYDSTELINDALKAGLKVGVYPVSERSWLDMGQWEELQKMLATFGMT